MGIKIFGLTGGVASGKSTVAAQFRAGGLDVIDADQIAREVVQPGSVGLREVGEAFGPSVLRPNGELDRGVLGGIVFADPSKRRILNGILHPKIAEATAAKGNELAAAGVTLAAYEAALLVENGLADVFRPLVVVSLPAGVQRQRLMARDGLDQEQADQRIAAQLSLAEKVALADYVIDNRGTKAELLVAADSVLAQIRAAAQTGT